MTSKVMKTHSSCRSIKAATCLIAAVLVSQALALKDEDNQGRWNKPCE
jgi:hypothetical protein